MIAKLERTLCTVLQNKDQTNKNTMRTANNESKTTKQFFMSTEVSPVTRIFVTRRFVKKGPRKCQLMKLLSCRSSVENIQTIV